MADHHGDDIYCGRFIDPVHIQNIAVSSLQSAADACTATPNCAGFSLFLGSPSAGGAGDGPLDFCLKTNAHDLQFNKQSSFFICYGFYSKNSASLAALSTAVASGKRPQSSTYTEVHQLSVFWLFSSNNNNNKVSLIPNNRSNNNNRSPVTLAEHISDHGRQTNSSTEA